MRHIRQPLCCTPRRHTQKHTLYGTAAVGTDSFVTATKHFRWTFHHVGYANLNASRQSRAIVRRIDKVTEVSIDKRYARKGENKALEHISSFS
jgi:hypothetical protein